VGSNGSDFDDDGGYDVLPAEDGSLFWGLL
jgi:hypothetical protein